MDKKGSNILEGEASESDEEVADYPSFIQNTMVVDFPSPTQQPKSPTSSLPGERSSGVVVSGEASESDEESYEYAKKSSGRDFPSLVSTFPDIPQMELKQNQNDDVKDSTKYRDEHVRPKYKSPFHKRLRENNFYLRCAIVENTLDTYEDASSKLQHCVPVLSRTQTAAQDTLHDMRVMIESLATVQLRFDFISDTQILPRFKEF